MLTDIAINIKETYKKINSAAEKANRNSREIKLIAVTKTVGTDVINEAINLGITDIGENRVQELLKKYDAIGDKVNWHMIGHLQKNKVKYIIDKVTLIHSVDSYSLAVEIDKRAKQAGKIMDCLLQVNVSGEESKFGLEPCKIEELLNKLSLLKNIRILGLMTIAPFVAEAEEIRKVFKDLKKLSLDIAGKKIHNISMEYLSMGMSNDFEIAIDEGSNYVRIGSKIFGERNY